MRIWYEDWRSLPDSARQLVDSYNQLGQPEKKEVLERIKSKNRPPNLNELGSMLMEWGEKISAREMAEAERTRAAAQESKQTRERVRGRGYSR